MIELRFVERSEGVQGPGESPTIKRVRILQYRQPVLPFKAASGDVSWYENSDAEWTDIPLVVLP